MRRYYWNTTDDCEYYEVDPDGCLGPYIRPEKWFEVHALDLVDAGPEAVMDAMVHAGTEELTLYDANRHEYLTVHAPMEFIKLWYDGGGEASVFGRVWSGEAEIFQLESWTDVNECDVAELFTKPKKRRSK